MKCKDDDDAIADVSLAKLIQLSQESITMTTICLYELKKSLEALERIRCQNLTR